MLRFLSFLILSAFPFILLSIHLSIYPFIQTSLHPHKPLGCRCFHSGITSWTVPYNKNTLTHKHTHTHTVLLGKTQPCDKELQSFSCQHAIVCVCVWLCVRYTVCVCVCACVCVCLANSCCRSELGLAKMSSVGVPQPLCWPVAP